MKKFLSWFFDKIKNLFFLLYKKSSSRKIHGALIDGTFYPLKYCPWEYQTISVLFLGKPAYKLVNRTKKELKGIEVNIFSGFKNLTKKAYCLLFCKFFIIVTNLNDKRILSIIPKIENFVMENDFFAIYLPLEKPLENLDLAFPVLSNTGNNRYIDNLKAGVKCLSIIFNTQWLYEIDYEDIKNTLAGAKFVYFGTGTAIGENRIKEATRKALGNLSESQNFGNAIYHVSGGDLNSIEINEGAEFFRKIINNKDEDILFGANKDFEDKDKVSVQLILSFREDTGQ
jgi:hypothetical protein